MDPEENVPPPSLATTVGRTMGGIAPPPPRASNLGETTGDNNASICSQSHSRSLLLVHSSVPSRSNDGSLRSSSSHKPLPPGMILTHIAKVVLRISPLAGSVQHGSIYLATKNSHQEDAITAYFESAGCDVLVMPCPNFEAFMAETTCPTATSSSS
jgi:hypothetical protein